MNKDKLYADFSKLTREDLEGLADEYNIQLCHLVKMEDVEEVATKLEVVQSILRERNNAPK